jgi:hypothetical protein
LYPERVKPGVWLPSWKRKDWHDIDLKDFSFLDAPENTIINLRNIVEAETKSADLRINFHDPFCLDVGPYLLLGMIRQEMLPICRGGTITTSLQKVIETVHLGEFLRMRPDRLTDRRDVWPFPLRFSRPVSRVSTWSPSQGDVPISVEIRVAGIAG